jgi:hypothetical protein
MALPRSSHRATISGMGVTYEQFDVGYPYVSAIYTCPCGKHAVRHAAEAGSPPPEWEKEHPTADAEYICPECARHRAARGDAAAT